MRTANKATPTTVISSATAMLDTHAASPHPTSAASAAASPISATTDESRNTSDQIEDVAYTHFSSPIVETDPNQWSDGQRQDWI
jgi:hypothetical protein